MTDIQKRFNPLKIFLTTLIAISLLWVSIYVSFVIVTNNINSYNNIYKELNTADYLGTTDEEVTRFASHILDYLYWGEDELQQTGIVHGVEQEIYTENEISHMEDVKKVITVFSWTSLVMACILITCSTILLVKKDLFYDKLKSIVISLISVLGILAVLVGIIAINFDSAFIVFHQIFFPQGNWSFPAWCVLVNVIEEEMLFQFALEFVLLSIFIIVSVLLTCKMLKKDSQKEIIIKGENDL